jgi:transcriptional regulator with XRE-family HTH domain
LRLTYLFELRCPMRSLVSIIGRRIAGIRDKAGFTQAELAERSGVQPETISRYEAGKLSVPLDRLKEIADVFGLRIQDLARAPSKALAHDTAIDRLLFFAASLSADEIELVMDIGGSAIKHLHKIRTV